MQAIRVEIVANQFSIDAGAAASRRDRITRNPIVDFAASKDLLET
jgi:hypothetical protein